MRRGKLFGLVMAVLAGSALSAAAVRLSDYPGPPAPAAAVAAATTALGSPPLDTPGPTVICAFWCPEPGGDNVVSYESPPDRTDVVAVAYDVAGARAADVEAAARSRLTAAGWRESADETLTRDRLRLTLQISDTAGGVHAIVVADKAVSPAAVALALGGFAVGAVLAGPAVAAGVRRYRRHGPAVRASVSALAWALTVLTVLWAAPLAVLLGGLVAQGGGQAKDVQLAEFVLTAQPWVVPATVVLLAAALVLLLLPPRRGPLALRLTPPVGQTH